MSDNGSQYSNTRNLFDSTHEFKQFAEHWGFCHTMSSVNSDALPAARQPVRITRYSSNSSVTYIPKKCRTLSYQRSFFVRCARIWNVLPESFKEHNQTTLAFKRSLLKYYTNAVDIFDQEDIRTWRTICPKCNTAKTLTRPPHCCF